MFTNKYRKKNQMKYPSGGGGGEGQKHFIQLLFIKVVEYMETVQYKSLSRG